MPNYFYRPSAWQEAGGVVGQATDNLSNVILRLAQMKQQKQQYATELGMRQEDIGLRRQALQQNMMNQQATQRIREEQARNTEAFHQGQLQHYGRQDENTANSLLGRLQNAQALLKLRQQMGEQANRLSQARIELARQKAQQGRTPAPVSGSAALGVIGDPLKESIMKQQYPAIYSQLTNALQNGMIQAPQAVPQAPAPQVPVPQLPVPQAQAPMTNDLKLHAIQAIRAGADPVAVRARYAKMSGMNPDF